MASKVLDAEIDYNLLSLGFDGMFLCFYLLGVKKIFKLIYEF